MAMLRAMNKVNPDSVDTGRGVSFVPRRLITEFRRGVRATDNEPFADLSNDPEIIKKLIVHAKMVTP